mgnify:CR=1 FL=1|jgi:SEC-C motif-containing protein
MVDAFSNKLCPCCSGKPFEQCCRPFLSGKKAPKTVKQLMRSRYTAYFLGGCGQYLYATWHPETRKEESPGSLSLKTVDWRGLEILLCKQQGDEGIVEFKAHFIDQQGNAAVHHEYSHFLRIKGLWYYVQPVKPQLSSGAQAPGGGITGAAAE